jgi:hypothetical protein
MAYRVTFYRALSGPEACAASGTLAAPAITAAGGRFLAPAIGAGLH